MNDKHTMDCGVKKPSAAQRDTKDLSFHKGNDTSQDLYSFWNLCKSIETFLRCNMLHKSIDMTWLSPLSLSHLRFSRLTEVWIIVFMICSQLESCSLLSRPPPPPPLKLPPLVPFQQLLLCPVGLDPSTLRHPRETPQGPRMAALCRRGCQH